MGALQLGLTFGAGTIFGLITSRVIQRRWGPGPPGGPPFGPFGGRCPKEAREKALAEAKAKEQALTQAQPSGDGSPKV